MEESGSPISDTKHKLDASRPQKVPYRPLDSSNLEIRLLHVDTRAPDSADRIQCRLEHVSLLDKPQVFYEAISWCWGDPTPRKEILLNGAPFKVSTNAEEVLRHLCFEQGHAVVWLDAVCIDQSNIQERGEQVAIMKDVYPRAERVLIWLGNDSNGIAEAALESIDKLVAHCREFVTTPEDENRTFWDSNGSPRFSQLELPRCDWTALETFFSAPLYSRLWFLQEVLLSKRASCFCGRSSKTWDEVSLAAQWLQHRSHWREGYMGYIVNGIVNVANMWRSARREYSFASWLTMATDMQTSLPSDKVYGLLGLLQTDGHRRLELKPDYNAPLDLVYTTAARLAIEEAAGLSNQLFMLRLAQILVPPGGQEPESCGRLSWPSWVPRYDWTYDARRSPVDIHTFGNGVADGLAAATIKEQDPAKPHVLSVKGFVVSHCSWRSALLSYELLLGDLHAFAEELLRCRAVAQEQGHSDEDIAIALTSRMDATGDDALKDVGFMEGYRRCLAACEEIVKEGQKRPQSSTDVTAAVVEYRKAMLAGIRNRIFFTTPSGHIGTAPDATESDDTVAILFGSLVPMVLREVGNGHWRLIGDAYVHGIMEGEYVRQLRDEGRLEEETRWFDIC